MECVSDKVELYRCSFNGTCRSVVGSGCGRVVGVRHSFESELLSLSIVVLGKADLRVFVLRMYPDEFSWAKVEPKSRLASSGANQ